MLWGGGLMFRCRMLSRRVVCSLVYFWGVFGNARTFDMHGDTMKTQ